MVWRIHVAVKYRNLQLANAKHYQTVHEQRPNLWEDSIHRRSMVSKTRNANGWGRKREKLIPNGVKCNEKTYWLSVLGLLRGSCQDIAVIPNEVQCNNWVSNLILKLSGKDLCLPPNFKLVSDLIPNTNWL